MKKKRHQLVLFFALTPSSQSQRSCFRHDSVSADTFMSWRPVPMLEAAWAASTSSRPPCHPRRKSLLRITSASWARALSLSRGHSQVMFSPYCAMHLLYLAITEQWFIHASARERVFVRRRKFTRSVLRIVMRSSRRLDVAENQLARRSNSSGGFPNVSVIYWGAV